jgi:putative membrane protein
MAERHNPVTVDVATQLAIERTRLAYERTLMAWIRTGTSLITFGFTIYKFFEEFRKAEQVARTGLIGAREFGIIMISIGLIAVVLATFQHVRIMHQLRAQHGGVPYSLAAIVAFLVTVLGIVALIAVIYRQ